MKAPIVSIAIEPNIFQQGTNPSWIPVAIALCGGLLFPIIGLSYVKNNINTDRDDGWLYLMQAMNMKKSNYLLGKFLSNLTVLTCVWLLTIISAAIMLPLQFPSGRIAFQDFISPFIGLYPGIAFASAFAIFLESVSFFNNRNGNAVGIVTLFIMFIITYSSGAVGNTFLNIIDFSNYHWLMDSVNDAVAPIIGRTVEESGILVPAGMFSESVGLQELVFHGLLKDTRYPLYKLLLLAICLFLVLISIFVLESGEKNRKDFAKKQKAEKKPFLQKKYRSQFFCEAKLLFNNISGGCKIFVFGLWVSAFLVPLSISQNYLWIIMLVFSVTVFSQIGCKVYENGMADLLVTIQSALKRQLFYAYLCGTVYLLAISSPLITRLLIAGNIPSVLSYIAFSMFIPALACLLGECSKSGRLFETIYLLICFLLLNMPSFLFQELVGIALVLCTFTSLTIAFFKRVKR